MQQSQFYCAPQPCSKRGKGQDKILVPSSIGLCIDDCELEHGQQLFGSGLYISRPQFEIPAQQVNGLVSDIGILLEDMVGRCGYLWPFFPYVLFCFWFFEYPVWHRDERGAVEHFGSLQSAPFSLCRLTPNFLSYPLFPKKFPCCCCYC